MDQPLEPGTRASAVSHQEQGAERPLSHGAQRVEDEVDEGQVDELTV